MADDRITTESVAVGAEETDPIVLRESETRRLVFNAKIVDKPEAPVRGYFVWQRKRAEDEWEDITGEALTRLKAGEGYSLELRSDEVATLLEGIQARKEIYEGHGIVFGQREYVAETALPEVVRKILEEPDSELARALQALDPPELLNLGRSVDLSKLDALLEEGKGGDLFAGSDLAPPGRGSLTSSQVLIFAVFADREPITARPANKRTCV